MSIQICKECSAPIDTDFHEMYDDLCENCANEKENKIQKLNQELNQELYKKKVIKDQWDYNSCLGYNCVFCGKEISPAVLKFFNYNHQEVLCYNCQTR